MLVCMGFNSQFIDFESLAVSMTEQFYILGFSISSLLNFRNNFFFVCFPHCTIDAVAVSSFLAFEKLLFLSKERGGAVKGICPFFTES